MIYILGIEIRENRKVLNMIDTKLGYIKATLMNIENNEIPVVHTYDCTEYPEIRTTGENQMKYKPTCEQ